jgi:HD-like signal output (HDOD) protein/CheY-like chemotaxis protein
MTHVLFVDDDERVLRGIRRTMRSTHPDWEMSFAADSEAALQQMESSGADVIVSDAQMPGVDGLALLQLVRMRYPETARIMLTGQVKKDQTYEAVGLVHQFLAKPCPPEELQAAIDRALHLRGLLEDPTLRGVVSRMRALPSQPAVYTRLMRAVRSEDVGLDEIASIVEENPSVAARVLQLVNSAFFGLPRPTASIKEAVVFIGTKTLRTLVLSVEAFRDLDLEATEHGLDPDALQEHAVMTARIASEMVPVAEHEAAYAAGLLHSIGVLVLASQLTPEWIRIVEEARSSERSLVDVEHLVLGVDHGQIGAALLSLWGLPHDVIEGVAQHLCPGVVTGFGGRLVGVTHVASRLADEVCAPFLPGVAGTPIDHDYLVADGTEASLADWRYLAERVAEGDIE